MSRYQAVIIDDEYWDIVSLRATLEGQEYFEITEEFTDARSGYAWLRDHRPALAFVDVRMPDLDGLSLLEQAGREGLPTLFIMISALDRFSHAKAAAGLNAVGYCLKPFDRADLLAKMKSAFETLENRQVQPREGSGVPDKASASGTLQIVLKESLPAEDTGSDKSVAGAESGVLWTGKPKSTVQRMLDYTLDHYTEDDLSIQKVAEYCSIHPNYASQVFKQETGRSFVSYLTGLRMDLACRLMEESGRSVADVAEQTGYSDSGYFSKVFRKEKGCSPSEYRKKFHAGITDSGTSKTPPGAQ